MRRRHTGEHDRPGCLIEANEKRLASGIPDARCRRWRQVPHHPGCVGSSLRSVGKQTDARFALASALPLETVARQATGDRKYGTEENLVAIESQHIHAYVPSPDNDHRTAFFSSQEFQYQADRDVYVCPAGQNLKRLLKKRGWGRRPFPQAVLFYVIALASNLTKPAITDQ